MDLDDLPKHEERFKRRLNENVLNEIGLLHGGLEDERQEIRDKIEQLNSALKLLEWKTGTFKKSPSPSHSALSRPPVFCRRFPETDPEMDDKCTKEMWQKMRVQSLNCKTMR